jgi:protein-S-isoprenylcysteine O-methyltransferase Ste14
MQISSRPHHPGRARHGRAPGELRVLVGSGDRIGVFVLPFLVVGVVLNIAYPSLFDVGGPPAALRVLSVVMLVPGVTIWGWSVVLILTKVPRGELITTGPYVVVKHPLYLAVAFLVLPWVGFLVNTWLGVVIGLALYAGSRLFASAEEANLSDTFGDRWADYCRSVKLPWF